MVVCKVGVRESFDIQSQGTSHATRVDAGSNSLGRLFPVIM